MENRFLLCGEISFKHSRRNTKVLVRLFCDCIKYRNCFSCDKDEPALLFQTCAVSEDLDRTCSLLHVRPSVLRVPWNRLERSQGYFHQASRDIRIRHSDIPRCFNKWVTRLESCSSSKLYGQNVLSLLYTWDNYIQQLLFRRLEMFQYPYLFRQLTVSLLMVQDIQSNYQSVRKFLGIKTYIDFYIHSMWAGIAQSV